MIASLLLSSVGAALWSVGVIGALLWPTAPPRAVAAVAVLAAMLGTTFALTAYGAFA